eukprot:scaffold22648_cov59-Phaeocystis_antarctica.AAC.1
MLGTCHMGGSGAFVAGRVGVGGWSAKECGTCGAVEHAPVTLRLLLRQGCGAQLLHAVPHRGDSCSAQPVSTRPRSRTPQWQTQKQTCSYMAACTYARNARKANTVAAGGRPYKPTCRLEGVRQILPSAIKSGQGRHPDACPTSNNMRLVLAALVLLSTADALIPQQQLRPQLPARLSRSAPLVAAATESESTGSSVASSTVNLVKAIVGSGVLSLPVGIAAFSSSRKALIPALVMLSVIGTLSAYCFAMVGRVCVATGTNTWGAAWKETVGEKSAWIPSSFVAILCASASLQYTMVIGDSFAPIFAQAGLPKLIASRSGAIALVTALCTLPLSLLPNLEMLKYTSFLGIGGLLYTAAFMAGRVGAYKPGLANGFHEAVPAALRPKFTDGAAAPALTLTLTPTLLLLPTPTCCRLHARLGAAAQ